MLFGISYTGSLKVTLDSSIGRETNTSSPVIGRAVGVFLTDECVVDLEKVGFTGEVSVVVEGIQVNVGITDGLTDMTNELKALGSLTFFISSGSR